MLVSCTVGRGGFDDGIPNGNAPPTPNHNALSTQAGPVATVEVSKEMPTLWPSLAPQAHPDLLPPRCGWLPLQERQPCLSLKK